MDIQYTTPEGGDKPSLEVTAEMIEAGAPILDRYDPDYSDTARYLTDIFRAMQAVQRHSAQSVKLDKQRLRSEVECL